MEAMKRNVSPQPQPPNPSLHDSNTISGGGEMGALIRAHDWSTSSLGAPESWPQSLKTALSICLGSKFPMFVWWGRALTVFYNDAYIPLAGPVKHPKYLGRPAREQWSEIWDVLGPLTEHVFTTGTATWSENLPLFMIRTGFVEETYFTFSYSPARDESGAVGGVFCACQETTARVLGERRLKVLRELGAEEVQSALEAGASATRVLKRNPNDVPFALVYLTSPDGKSATLAGASGIEAGSQAAPETIDLTSPSEGDWPIAGVNKNRQPERVDGLRSLFSTQLPETPYEEMPDSAYVLPIELAGQETFAGFLILGISPRLAFNDSYQGFFGLVCKHITNQISNVRALEEEKKRSEALAESDRAKTKFFSNVSHEFRTPLALMIGPIADSLADTEQPLPPRQRERQELLQRNSLRLLKLVNSLLDFSRIEAGRVQAFYEATDLAALTTELASVFRSAVEKAGLRLIIDCPPLPQPIYVDREMWEKIVLNLVSNAFKFTFEGEIRVALRLDAQQAELTVQDTGVGIPQEELPHVFDRFHRVEGTKARTIEGSGIGLSLVQELVKLHGGRARVASEPGRGTTFSVVVPMGSNHLPKNRTGSRTTEFTTGATAFVNEATRWLPESTTAQDAVLPTPLNSDAPLERMETNPRPRILVADDNADLRDYLRRLLQQHWTVEVVEDGMKALAAARANVPDLVLADVMMPHLDGFQLLRELRADERTMAIPVVMLSARAGEEARIDGLAAGVDDYLIKPFSSREVLARVRSQLEMVRMRREVNRRAMEAVQLRESVRIRDEFLSTASHELRTPLTPLQLELDILARSLVESGADEKLRGRVDRARRQTQRLIRLVENLL